MANVAARKLGGIQGEDAPLLEELFGEIRRRESDADLIETKNQFEARIAAPGFAGKDIQVTALPDAIVVQAEVSHLEEREDDGIVRTQFGERKLFRRIDLPGLIECEAVRAKLKGGMITVVAPKADAAAR